MEPKPPARAAKVPASKATWEVALTGSDHTCGMSVIP